MEPLDIPPLMKLILGGGAAFMAVQFLIWIWPPNIAKRMRKSAERRQFWDEMRASDRANRTPGAYQKGIPGFEKGDL